MISSQSLSEAYTGGGAKDATNLTADSKTEK